ncbi:MAG TPA: uroporphyrinogen decarboxylase family protein [Candidatus Lokiarchaeia archaeon]|nr:uroporphyrinogen decarboxylase family protein [Candidatus Lokiarchaeia archaeon]
MDKRERVMKTISHEEPDLCPVHYLGFEKTASAYENFVNSSYYENCVTDFEYAGNIAIPRFLNVDVFVQDPFYEQIHYWLPNPLEYPEYNYKLNVVGRLYKTVKIEKTGQDYAFYEKGYYTTEEILKQTWDAYGKPHEYMLDGVDYNPNTWRAVVEECEPYFVPMGRLVIPMHEALFEGMTLARLAYYMRRKPSYIHEVMAEYTATNIANINGLADAGVEILMYNDDIAQKERSIISLTNFREFILPYYQQIYDACKKRGMFVIQHSCGYVDEFLPEMVNIGLPGIQSLEPAAGVDLSALKKKFGDRLVFLGGIDSSRILNFGTPDDIENEVKRCLAAAGAGGGYFVGPSHDILNVPFENLLALRDAIEKHRAYPLQV